MAQRPTETALYFWNHRAMSPRMVVPFVEHVEASGVVDHFQMFDVMAGWFPPAIWNREFTPLADFGDFDSVYDGFMTSGIAASHAAKLGMLIQTNSLRHGPAEIMQRAMTLADAAPGGAICCVGAGEAYNTTPFGYNRRLSVSRLEDHLRLYRLLWDCEGPIDYEGRTISFDQAYLGTVRGRRPEFWGMGAGPRLQKITARYADGWMTAAPNAFPDPDQFASKVQEIRNLVEDAGRDPETFRFGLSVCTLMHEDPAVIEQVVANPLIAFLSALLGRLNNADWAAEGIDPPFPPEFNYSMEYLPMKLTAPEVMGILERTPRALVEKSWVSGSPKEVSLKLQEYVDAGADLIAPYDFLPGGLSDLGEMPASMARLVDLCGMLKSSSGPPASA